MRPKAVAKIIGKNRGSDLTMTNKEREAIEICKEKIIEPFYDFPNPTSIELKDTDVDAIDTVLSMLKENSAEIEQKSTELAEKNAEIEKLKKEKEHWKNGFERELEDNRKNTCELLKQDVIIRKKDKMIDLMAKTISNNIVITYFNDAENVKRYYEKLVKTKSEQL